MVIYLDSKHTLVAQNSNDFSSDNWSILIDEMKIFLIIN